MSLVKVSLVLSGEAHDRELPIVPQRGDLIGLDTREYRVSHVRFEFDGQAVPLELARIVVFTTLESEGL